MTKNNNYKLLAMALTDTKEYWDDVKSSFNKRIFTHIKGIDCGHYHVAHSDELQDIDCFACKKIIDNDDALKQKLLNNNGKAHQKYANKKGYKLDSIIKFGKFKGQLTIRQLIDQQPSYFKWLKDKLLVHIEVDNYLVK